MEETSARLLESLLTRSDADPLAAASLLTRRPDLRAWQSGPIDGTRIDQWLWAVRLYPTRSAATAACRGGHVKVNGASAKPASPVRVGDRIEARIADRDRVVEVVRLIEKRVGAPIAAACLVDHSPPPPTAADLGPGARGRGAGRPTKRDRRELDRFTGRDGRGR